MYKISDLLNVLSETKILKTKYFIAIIVMLAYLAAGVVMPLTANASGAWSAKYWNLDPESGSSPEFPDGTADLTRTDVTIDFDWEEGSPDESINNENFAVEWKKSIYFDGTGYKINTRSDDGTRVYVDDDLVIDNWYDQGGEREVGDIISPTAGTHLVTIQYYENTGGAKMYFSMGKAIGASDVIGQPNLKTDGYNNFNPSANGFDYPYALQVDTVHHRLFVADEDDNRVLVFNLSSTNQLTDKTADYVLGQADMISDECGDATAQSLCEPYDLAYDSANDRLFVADSDNYRVLVYDTATITNGEAATKVLGQPDFETFECCDVDANSMYYPYGVTYDNSHNRLFVADSDNDRILVFDTATITNGEAAVNVLGQEALDESDEDCAWWEDVTADGFCWVPHVEYDSANNRLFASDSGNQRVVVFDVASITNGEDAVKVLGQDTLTSFNSGSPAADNILDPRTMSFDSTNDRLFVTDAGWSGSNRVLVFDLEEFNDGEAAVNVLGQADFESSSCNRGNDDPAANTLCRPYGVDYDATQDQLFVADSDNSRILLFDTESITDGEDAVDVLGQSDFTGYGEYGLTEPNATGFDGPFQNAIDTVHHRMFAVDRWNDRVLVFNLDSDNSPASKTAAYVIGQPDMETDGCGEAVTDQTLCDPFGVAYDNTNDRLFVSDKSNRRVLVYDVSSGNIENGLAADYVLGQPGFDSNDNNSGDRSVGLSQPMDIAMDSQHQYLYVADRNNHRVVGYNVAPGTIENGQAASRVFGQANTTSGTCNRGSSTAANTLCYPRSVAVNPVTNQLFIADGTNEQHNENRVLAYDLNSYSAGMAAGAVLGQTSFDDEDCNINDDFPLENSLCNPIGLAVDNTNHHLYVSDEWNDRVMVFDTDPETIENGQAAVKVIGQANFNNDDCDAGSGDYDASAYGICGVAHVSVNQSDHSIYLSDVNNHRVLYFTSADLNVADAEDADGDGISDAVEDAGPNGGDANNDGIADSQQANVSSFVNSVSGKHAVLEVADTCTIESVAVNAESSESKDAGFDYPVGLMNFTVTCDSPGATTHISQYYYDLPTSGLSARKYDSNNQSYRSITSATITHLSIDGRSVAKATYNVTDGGDLDEDGEVNSTIIDPSGLAQSAVGSPDTGLGGGL